MHKVKQPYGRIPSLHVRRTAVSMTQNALINNAAMATQLLPCVFMVNSILIIEFTLIKQLCQESLSYFLSYCVSQSSISDQRARTLKSFKVTDQLYSMDLLKDTDSRWETLIHPHLIYSSRSKATK